MRKLLILALACIGVLVYVGGMRGASTRRLDYIRDIDMQLRREIDWELLRAVRRGDEAEVMRLLGEGANIEVRDFAMHTPLMNAAYEGHENIARILLDNGADIEAKDPQGFKALDYAAHRGHENIAQLIRNYGRQQAAAFMGTARYRPPAGAQPPAPARLPRELLYKTIKDAAPGVIPKGY